MKKKGIALVERQYLFPFVLITSLFFLWGFAHAILDVLNKHFQELLTITRTHSAMIQATMYMGYFIMAIPAGLFINRHGYRKGVVLGLLLYGIGSLLFIPGQYIASFSMFLFSLFVIGCGLTFLETAANPYVTELGARETAASRLNFAQSFNGLGCIFAPILTGLLLFSDEDKGASGNVALPYAVMGVIVLLAALAFMRVRLPEIPHEEEVDSEGHRVGLWAHAFCVRTGSTVCLRGIRDFHQQFLYQLRDRGWLDECPRCLAGAFVRWIGTVHGRTFRGKAGLCAVSVPRRCSSGVLRERLSQRCW